MANIEAKKKMQYYPTPPAVIELIENNLLWPRVSPTKDIGICDPFAGKGEALAQLAILSGVKCTTWGNELNVERAKAARKKLNHVLQGPAEFVGLVDPSEGFSMLLYNPPYDKVGGERLESLYLGAAIRLLMPGGVLVAILPQQIVKDWRFTNTLTESCRVIAVRRFPEEEYERFKQIVIFATRLENQRDYPYKEIQKIRETVSCNIPRVMSKEFEIEVPITRGQPAMENTMPAPSYVIGALATETLLLGRQWIKATIPERDSNFIPLEMPERGHAAQLLAAGMLDGVEVDRNLLKGYSYKYLETNLKHKTNLRGERESYYETRERMASVIVAMDSVDGELAEYDSKKDIQKYQAFLSKHLDMLLAAVHNRYTPLYDGDFSKFEPVFGMIHSPGKLPGHEDHDGLLDKQKQKAAAIATHYLAGEKGAILVGDMGTGKTLVSQAIIALITTRLTKTGPDNRSKTVVVIPPHLKKKWKREIETCLREFGVKAFVCRSVTDVDKAFAYPGMAFIILGQQVAKNNSPWQPHINWITKRERDDDQQIVETKIMICPVCGHELSNELAIEIQVLKSKTSFRYRRGCIKCCSPLWSEIPYRTKGKLPRYSKGVGFRRIHKFDRLTGFLNFDAIKDKPEIETSRGRRALARYISKKYANRYSLIVDEIQDARSGDTNIGTAVGWLCTAARKILFMTGTLYSGFASSLFHVSYRAFPFFRELHSWNGVSEFVDLYGLREFKSERKPRYESSAFGYQRIVGVGTKGKELPGTNPHIVSLLLRQTAFMYIEDITEYLPKYDEYKLKVALPGDDPIRAVYDMEIMGRLKDAARRQMAKRMMSLMGQFRQASLGYLDRPEEDEKFTDGEITIKVPPVIGHNYEKDNALIKLITSELAHNRRTLVYFMQVKRRDPMPRIKNKLLNIGVKVAILRTADRYSDLPNGKRIKVKNEDREEYVEKVVDLGTEVMFCSPELVQTGLDLVAFPNIVFFGISDKLDVVRQSEKRSWRLGQKLPVKVIYMYWAQTAQQNALHYIARKKRAAYLVDGRSIDGLAAVGDDRTFIEDLVNAALGTKDPKLNDYEFPEPPIFPPVRNVILGESKTPPAPMTYNATGITVTTEATNPTAIETDEKPNSCNYKVVEDKKNKGQLKFVFD